MNYQYPVRDKRGHMPADRIDVEPIAQAVLQSGLTWSQICRNLEWVRDSGRPDTSRLRRRLGLLDSVSCKKGKVYRGRQKTMGYELAAKIVRAAGVDPVDAGL